MKFVNYIFIILFLFLNNNLFGMNCFDFVKFLKPKAEEKAAGKLKRTKCIELSDLTDELGVDFEDDSSTSDNLDKKDELKPLEFNDIKNNVKNEPEKIENFETNKLEVNKKIKLKENKFDFFEFEKKFENLPTYAYVNAINIIVMEYAKRKKIPVDFVYEKDIKSDNFKAIVKEYMKKYPGKITGFDESKTQSYNKIIELEEFVNSMEDFFAEQQKSSLCKKESWLDGKVPDVVSQDEYLYYKRPREDIFNFYGPMEEMLYDIVVKDSWMKKKEYKSFFYTKKIVFPKDTIFKAIGDRHGDIMSTKAFFKRMIKKGFIDKDLKILKENVFFYYLGDYVDRGYNSCEVLSLIQRFKVVNWDKVWFLRGNHENLGMNVGGLLKEIYLKYRYCAGFDGLFPRIRFLINKFYCSLPSAVYIQIDKSKDFMLLSHGSIDPRFDPEKLKSDPRECVFQQIGDLSSVLPKKLFCCDNLCLESDLVLNDEIKYICSNLDIMRDIDTNSKTISANYFINGDYNFLPMGDNNKFDIFETEKTKRRALGEKIVRALFEKTGVRCQLRGHQHHVDYGDMIHNLVENFGIYNVFGNNKNLNNKDKLWTGKNVVFKLADFGLVWTLGAAPDSIYGDMFNYKFDTYVTVKIGENFDTCTMVPSKIDILS